MFYNLFTSLTPLSHATVDCKSKLVDDARRCFMVGGGFTFIGLNDTDIRWSEEFGYRSTETIMNSGQLNDADRNIAQVYYIQDGRANLTRAPANAPVEPSSGKDIGDDGFDLASSWPWLLALGGFVVFLVIFTLIGRMQKAREQQNRR